MSELRAFERDPYLRTLTTEIVVSGRDSGGPWAVLADTVLYPEGGGQPADRGTVAGVEVRDVQTVDGAVRHSLARPLEPGPVTVELDWERRFDHMQQHSGQHLLTAVAQDRLGWHTTAFHLSAAVCDIELDVAAVTEPDLARLEEAVAAEIRAARPIRDRRVTTADYQQLDVRSRGLPDGHCGDIRLVEIEGIDLNTCGGTHLRSTAEIELVQLLATEPARGGTRLMFVAGGRARRRMRGHEVRNLRLRQLLGGGDDDLPDLVAAKMGQLKEVLRRERALERELAEALASVLAAGEAVEGRHFEGPGMGFLQQLARAYAERRPTGVVLLTTLAAEGGMFVIAAGDRAPIDLPSIGGEIAGLLGGKGGGKGRLFQGKASDLSGRREALTRLRSALRV